MTEYKNGKAVVTASFRGTKKPTKPKLNSNASLTKQERDRLPAVPVSDIDLHALRDEATTAPKKAWAAFAMRKRMIPFTEIAEFLDYGSEAEARNAVVKLLAETADPEQTATLRSTLIAGLEDQLQRSIGMASARTLRLPNGKEIRNLDQMSWHAEARRDYEILARVSGAMAPQQVQLISATDEELESLVSQIERAQGKEIVDAEVVELDEIEDPSDGPII